MIMPIVLMVMMIRPIVLVVAMMVRAIMSVVMAPHPGVGVQHL
jgi:hypothetical protein